MTEPNKPTPDEQLTEQPDGWERDLVNRLAFATLNEQRRTRRWSIFYRSMFLLIIALFLVLQLLKTDTGIETGSHTALVEINGVISAETEASADNIVTGLRAAFKDDDTAGVVLRINSPGGSPVQAGYVNDEIRRLRKKYPDIPLYAVVSDICASGGYYIAVAADKIYADKASMVGSIGVLMNSFGFVDTLDKLGIERRLYTAGDKKGFLDPFSPEVAEDVLHLQTLLDDIHGQFIDLVKEGRGDRLSDTAELFSGYIWTGEQALGLGLIDELGSSSYVAREVIGEERIKDFTHEEDYLDRLIQRLGSGVAQALIRQLQLQQPALQ